MKQVGDGANLGAHLLDEIFAIGQRVGGLGQTLDVGAYGRQIHVQSRQHLSHAVVKLARDAAALVILQLEQAGGKSAQILIGAVEIRCAFENAGFEFPLRLAQYFVLAPTRFGHHYHEHRRKQEC